MALGDEIITLADVRQYRDVDQGYDSQRFSGFLREVQETDLRQLLGDELWLDFFDNIGDTNYQRLIDGDRYEYAGEIIYYPGLKPFLIWAWLGKLPLEGNVHHTQSGDFSYMRETTMRPMGAESRQAKENYKKNSLIESNKIKLFLNQNNTDYPLWDDKDLRNQTNFQFDII